MADKTVASLTSSTPTIDDLTISYDNADTSELKKTTWQLVRDLFKTYFDTIYQAVLVSGTNIKTVNGNTLLGSGDLAIPVLTDGDKGDITLTSSATVWTIDNGVVTNAKQANVSSNTIKGRTTVGTGSPEDLTPTQVTSMLDNATTSLKGLMSPTDKTKLDSVASGAGTFVGCSLYHSSSQTFSDISLTYAIFNSEFFDTDGFHDTAVNNSRITIPTGKAGKYFVCGNIQTGTYSATGRFTIRLAKNGTLTGICQESYGLSTDTYSNTGGFQISTIMDLSVGDYIELGLACNGANVSSDASLNTNKNFSVYKIG